jgi:hypothetical protein
MMILSWNPNGNRRQMNAAMVIDRQEIKASAAMETDR